MAENENEMATSKPEAGESSFADWIWAGNLIRKQAAAGVVIAFILGVVVGLVVLGWWLWPVQWINTDPADLKQSHQDSYLQMIADSYALTGNVEIARARLEALKGPGRKDADLSALLNALIKARIEAGKADDAMRLQELMLAMALPPPASTPAKPTVTARSLLLRIAGIIFFLFLLSIGVLLLFMQSSRRQSLRRRRPPTPSPPFSRVPEWKAGISTPSESALGYFETTYNLGDEGYDVSYSIETPSGEFLGECGISALEDAEIGGPGKSAAFEIWLFDKDDVRTETKVLVSEGAFGDMALREKLASKGELTKATEGQPVILETANLRLKATITELAYESGSNAGIFAKLTTRLEISQRGTAA